VHDAVSAAAETAVAIFQSNLLLIRFLLVA